MGLIWRSTASRIGSRDHPTKNGGGAATNPSCDIIQVSKGDSNSEV